MKNNVRKRFAWAIAGTGIGAALILLGPNHMQPRVLGCETYSGYVKQQKSAYKKLAKVLDKIRTEINQLHEEGQNKVIVFGRYSTDSEMIKGEYNGFLELTVIWIYDKEGNYKPYAIEGVIGGVR